MDLTALDGVDLNELTRDELIALVESQQERGIRISFSGKENARGLGRRVRPRVTRAACKSTTRIQGLDTPPVVSICWVRGCGSACTPHQGCLRDASSVTGFPTLRAVPDTQRAAR